jgi:hypothetical protein
MQEKRHAERISPMVTKREVRLSPSNLNYEDRRCDRCFAEATNGESWPQRPFAGIFAKLDSQQRRYFTDRSTSDIDPTLPPGTLHNGGRVQSAPHTIGGVDFTIRGSMDALLRFDNGSVGVVDFKSSTASPQLGDAYRPQLAAYQWALSRPASGDPEEVSVAGLLVFAPESMVDTEQGRAYLVSTTWIPVEIEDGWFENFLGRIAPLIQEPKEAPSKTDCEWCSLRTRLSN